MLDLAHGAQPLGQRDRQRLLPRSLGDVGKCSRRRVGQRHERTPLLFRQRTQVRDHLVAQPRRHEPFELDGRDRAEQRARHGHRDAVGIVAGLEDVAERQPLSRNRELARVAGGREIAGIAGGDVGQRHA